ncbi:MAG TPA: hypothetical protein VJV78_39680 [Polyangiales bacterium]|nr:hypothetical protein [Polyangiales bacterium]
MRTNQTKWSVGLVAACFVVGLAAVGCGDDSDGGAAGSGGSAGSAGASGSTGGSGGAAGKSGSGGGGSGGGPSVMECVTKTNAAQGPAANMACNMCLCQMGTKDTLACSNNADCWKLIGCIRQNCPADNSCATMPTGVCYQFVAGGAATATPVGQLIRGACMSTCVTTPTGDGGAADAGI